MAYFKIKRTLKIVTGAGIGDDPGSFTAFGLGTAIELSWNPVVGASGYRLYRNTVNNLGTATEINNSNVLEFVDVNRLASTQYYYWVKSTVSGVDSAGASTSFVTGAYRTDIIVPGPNSGAATGFWLGPGSNFMTTYSFSPGDVIILNPGWYSTLDFMGYYDDITLCSSNTGTVNVTGRINFGPEGKHNKVVGNMAVTKNIVINSGLAGYFACSSRSSGINYFRNLDLQDNFMGVQVEHRETSDPEFGSYLLPYQNLTIRDINIDGTGQEAMYIGSNIISPHQIYGIIRDCTIANCGRDGIQTRNGLFTIYNNTINDVGMNGEDAHGHGILYGGGGGDATLKTTIMNNTVHNAAVYGLFCNGYGHIWVENNTFHGGILTAPTQAQFSGLFFKNYESNTEDILGIGFQHFTLKNNSFTTVHGDHAVDIRRDNVKCPVTVDYYQSTMTLSPNDTYIEDGVHGAAYGIVTNIL